MSHGKRSTGEEHAIAGIGIPASSYCGGFLPQDGCDNNMRREPRGTWHTGRAWCLLGAAALRDSTLPSKSIGVIDSYPTSSRIT